MTAENESEKRFQYRARRMNGQLVKGDMVAADIGVVRQLLKDQGLVIIDVSPWSESKGNNFKDFSLQSIAESLERVSSKDLLVFTQQIQTIYSVGIPIVDGLALIREQFESNKIRRVIQQLITDISNGMNLSSAMAKHPSVFDEIYVNMIRVGEASGQLEDILLKLYNTIDARNQNANRIKSAMFYPKMVFGMIAIVFLVVTFYVVPNLEKFYDSLGAKDLPLPTRIVVGISNGMINNAFLWMVIFGAGYYSFQKWVKTERGGLLWDSFKLKLPIFGPLIRDVEMASICTLLEMLIRSGLGIVQAFEVLKKTLSNKVVQQDVENARIHTLGGGRIGDSLKQSKTVPKMLAGLIAIGEEAGSLERVLNRSGKYYQDQVDYKIGNLSKAIEPILLAITFGFVLLLALAILLPIWNMSSAVRR